MVLTLKVRIFAVVAALLMAVTGMMMLAQPAEAYWSRLCSGYGSVYHTHPGPPKYYQYTYGYRSGGYPYMEYWTWSSPTGWVYRGWAWC